MIVLKPTFYDKFKCIADKCSYTCCCDWDIDIDGDTVQKYNEIGESEKLSVDKHNGGHRIKITKEGVCPFLNESGLCGLVLQYGPSMLSVTCDIFPRFYVDNDGVYECALSNACPAVLDFLWDTPSPLSFVMEEKNNEIMHTRHNLCTEWISSRNTVIDILQCREMPLWKRLFLSYHFANRMGNVDRKQQEAIIEQYGNTQFLVKIATQLQKEICDYDYKVEYELELWKRINKKFNRYRGYQKHIQPFMELSASSLACFAEEWIEFEDAFGDLDEYMENLCVNSLFTQGALMHKKETFVDNCALIILEYVMVQFTIFLLWRTKKTVLPKADIINISCYYARIMEHNADKIMQFLEELMQAGLFGMAEILLLLS